MIEEIARSADRASPLASTTPLASTLEGTRDAAR
jgi:hypothetical protein